MKNLTFLSLTIILSFFIFSIQAQSTLSVQGVLKNSDGTAIPNGDKSIIFKLYDANNNNAELWMETQVVEVKGGVYSVQLGDSTALPAFTSQNIELGVTVDGSELSPRSKLTSAPFALALIGDDNIIGGNGNVGIGTTNPSSPLEVVGTLEVNQKIQAGDNGGLEFATSNGTTRMRMYNGGNIGIPGWISADGGNEGMKIENNGNIGINKWISADGGNEGIKIANNGRVGLSSTGTSFTPDGALHIKESDANLILQTPSNDFPPKLTFRNSGTEQWHFVGPKGGGDSSLEIKKSLNGVETTFMTFRFQSSGFVGFGGQTPTHPLHMASGAHVTSSGAWQNSSDIRLKRDIAPINYGLNEVLSLNPVTYNMKADGTPQIGFIAQDVRKIIPEVVSGIEGDMSKGETLGMSYGQLNAVIVKAMQEQQAEIEVLKAHLLKLEKMISESKK